MEWLLVEMTVKHGGLIYSSDGVKISFRPDRNDTRLVVEIETVDGYDKIAQRRCIDAFRADIQMRSAMWPWLTHEVHAVRAMATLASPPAATNQSVSGQQPPPPTGPVLPPLRRTGATKPAKAKPEKNTLKE
ncbi:MAG: hypothetical protein KJ579_04765 [Verrucomicrobia bacterium]|nr:hypothetical protein [Verrucomicrobiota bacterium]